MQVGGEDERWRERGGGEGKRTGGRTAGEAKDEGAVMATAAWIAGRPRKMEEKKKKHREVVEAMLAVPQDDTGWLHIANLQKVAVAEPLQLSYSVRGPMEALESGRNTYSSGRHASRAWKRTSASEKISGIPTISRETAQLAPECLLDTFGPEESEEKLGLSRFGRRLSATLQPAGIIGLREG